MRRTTFTLLLVLSACFVCAPMKGCGEPSDTSTETIGDPLYSPDGSLRLVEPRSPESPNLVVLILDTLRRDALDARTPDAAPMPRLSRRASRSVVFEQAVAPAPWTVPSITSLLTGRMPHGHGCVHSQSLPRLAESVVTYAEVLSKGHGYETAFFSNGPWSLTTPWSILQGFEGGVTTATTDRREQERGFGIEVAPAVVAEWAAARDPARPFFLVLHTFDVHDPYGRENHAPQIGFGRWEQQHVATAAVHRDVSSLTTPAQQVRTFLLDRVDRHALYRLHGPSLMTTVARFMWSGFREAPDPALAAELKNRYDAGAGWVDEGIEVLLEGMRTSGLLDNTLLVVTSDHGEAFGEHGTLGHGHHLHDEVTGIPLVMSGPGPFAEARSIDQPAGLIDVLPTFLDFAGIRDIAGTAGRSLLPALRGEPVRDAVFSEALVTPDLSDAGVRRIAVSARSSAWKYVVTYDVGQGTIVEELYDVRRDPRELRDLAVRGRIGDPAIPIEFCRAIEQARDLIWSDAAEMGWRANTPYGVGVAQLSSERPPSCDEHQPR